MTTIRNKPAMAPKTILVVDDAATIRNILVQVLRLQGYNVLSAMNGADALRLIEESTEPIDVLVTDLMMPLMGGEELIAKTALIRPEIRVICLSASLTEVTLNRAVLFLPKPFSLSAIVRSVGQVLGCAFQQGKKTG
jgi:two-component system, cell cycle sensor histidine kinase and response regulator CckA